MLDEDLLSAQCSENDRANHSIRLTSTSPSGQPSISQDDRGVFGGPTAGHKLGTRVKINGDTRACYVEQAEVVYRVALILLSFTTTPCVNRRKPD